MEHIYIAIDMKSFYASVECVARGLDPLKTDLLVADPTRSDQTICLAVSPSLKAKGVPGRPRLFEAKQAIARYEADHRCKVDYITAVPRMAEYIRAGKAWTEYKIKVSQVLKRNEHTGEGSERIWEYAKENYILPSLEDGCLADDRKDKKQELP